MQSLRFLSPKVYSTVPKTKLPHLSNKHNSLYVSLTFHNPSKTDFVNLHKLLFNGQKIYDNKFHYVLDNSAYIHYSTSRLENINLTKIFSDSEYCEKTLQEYIHIKYIN